MEFPKLKLPPKGYSRAQAYDDCEKSGTFAGRLHSVMNRYEENNVEKLTYSRGAGERAIKQKACALANDHYDSLRRYIDQEMQEYILEHDGQIDSWADSTGDIEVSYYKGTRFRFDYFGADYAVSSFKKVGRTSSKLVYRNRYRFPGTEEYNEAASQREKLEEKVRDAKKATSTFSWIISLIGFLYCAYGVLSILGEIFFGIGEAIAAMYQSGVDGEGALASVQTLVGFIIVLPVGLQALIEEIAGEIDSSGIFCTVLLIGACVVGALFCLSAFWEYNGAAKNLKRAKKELAVLLKSPGYRKTVAENDALRKSNEELAEQWHRAWYDWVCGIKDKAAEADTDEVFDKADEAFQQAFQEKVANTDFNELLRQKIGEE